MKNRRRFERYECLVEIRYKSADGKIEGYSFSKDLSRGGICLPLDTHISPYTRLEIVIDLPSEGKRIIASGIVVWSHKNTCHWEPLYSAGLKFERMDPVSAENLISFASNHRWQKTDFEQRLEHNQVPLVS
ncbi:MAG: PilZ domain-containing protein [Candidatus Omnitrophica bacterium]|nr:PilZ domain-containing protein [Candidatus Omnitrophota bacterium]